MAVSKPRPNRNPSGNIIQLCDRRPRSGRIRDDSGPEIMGAAPSASELPPRSRRRDRQIATKTATFMAATTSKKREDTSVPITPPHPLHFEDLGAEGAGGEPRADRRQHHDRGVAQGEEQPHADRPLFHRASAGGSHCRSPRCGPRQGRGAAPGRTPEPPRPTGQAAGPPGATPKRWRPGSPRTAPGRARRSSASSHLVVAQPPNSRMPQPPAVGPRFCTSDVSGPR